MSPRALVTGAFSNIGAAASEQLRTRGWEVSTLTNRTPPAGTAMASRPLRFDRAHLDDAFDGIDCFVNTYWIRFPRGAVTFDSAVANTGALIDTARRAGVRRFVHVSVSNASLDSRLGYYRGKAQIEAALRGSGLSYAIVRPTLVVGPNDVLTNNMAWFLRRMPVIGVPRGSGYRLQPVTLDDVGRIVADAAESTADLEVDAAGPEVFTFREYLEALATAVDRRPRFAGTSPGVMLASLWLAGLFLRDTVLTREELLGLRDECLLSRQPPLGMASVAAWLAQHGDGFGHAYTNDTVDRFRVPR